MFLWSSTRMKYQTLLKHKILFSADLLRQRFTMIKQSTIKIRLVHVKLLLYLPCLYWWSSIFSEVLPLLGCMSVRIKFIMHVSQQLLIGPKKKKYCVFRVTQPTNHNIARPFLSSQENSTEKAQQCCDCRLNLQKTYVPFSDSVYFRLLFSYYFH